MGGGASFPTFTISDGYGGKPDLVVPVQRGYQGYFHAMGRHCCRQWRYAVPPDAMKEGCVFLDKKGRNVNPDLKRTYVDVKRKHGVQLTFTLNLEVTGEVAKTEQGAEALAAKRKAEAEAAAAAARPNKYVLDQKVSFTIDAEARDGPHSFPEKHHGVFPGTLVMVCDKPGGIYRMGADTDKMAQIRELLSRAGVFVTDSYFAEVINAGHHAVFLPEAKIQAGWGPAEAFWKARAAAAEGKRKTLKDKETVSLKPLPGGGDTSRYWAGMVINVNNERQLYTVRYLNYKPNNFTEKNVHSARLIQDDGDKGREVDRMEEAAAIKRAEEAAKRAAIAAEEERVRAIKEAEEKASKLVAYKKAHPEVAEPKYWSYTNYSMGPRRWVTPAEYDALDAQYDAYAAEARARREAERDADRAAAAAMRSGAGGAGAGSSSSSSAPRQPRTRAARIPVQKVTPATCKAHQGKKFSTGRCPVCGAATGRI